MEPIALIGEVIFINNKEGFGFLRSENHPKILFLFRDSRLRQSSNAELKGSLEANPKNRYSPALGDWVSFKLKDFETKPGPLNAFEVRFISNPNQEKFMVYIQNHDEFLGELIIKNEKYYHEQEIEHIDNPEGRIKFKVQMKINIGLCLFTSHYLIPN
jgi:hypothetical protein